MTWLSRLLPPTKTIRYGAPDFSRLSKQRRRRLTLESLEDRRVLSNVAVAFDALSGVLTITPDRFDNQFRITEQSTASGGKVEVRALPLAGSVFSTTINGTAVPFTTTAAVTKINVNFQGGNDKDRVELVGPGAAATTVKDVNFALTTTTLTSLAITGANNSGAFSLTTASGLPSVDVNSSRFQSLQILQTGNAPSAVRFAGDTISGPVNVSLGNANNSAITVNGGSKFGPTNLVQGNGNDAQVAVQNSTVQQLGITQGSGARDRVTVGSVSLSPIGTGLRVTQNGGNNDSVAVTAVTAVLPTAPAPVAMFPSIVVIQGDGNDTTASVASSNVTGDIRITQGNGYRDSASITDSSAGFVVPASPPTFPAPIAVFGTASIIQGDGVGNTATVSNGALAAAASFNNVFIHQGASTNAIPQPAPQAPLYPPNTATVSNVRVYNDVTVTQDSAAGGSAGNSAMVSNSPSAQGSIAIDQLDGAYSIASITGSPALNGYVTIDQGDGIGDHATIGGSSAGLGLSIAQGDGDGDSAEIYGSSTAAGGIAIVQGDGIGVYASITSGTATAGGASIAQGDGDGAHASIDGVTATVGDVSIAQGDGAGNYAGISVTAGSGDVSITQGDGDAAFAAISGSTISDGDATIVQGDGFGVFAAIGGTTAPMGDFSITQGDGDEAHASVTGSTAGSRVPFGPFIFPVEGDVTITQGSGDGNIVDVLESTMNSLAVTQGEASIGNGAVNVDDAYITGNLDITQGGAGSLGGYSVYIAQTGDVTVGGTASINQSGGNNVVFLGAVDGTTNVFAFFLEVYTGDVGGALVAATNVTVYAGPFYVIDGGGDGNTFFDGGGNSGITVSPSFNVA